MNNHVEVKGATALQVGGYRLEVTPEHPNADGPAPARREALSRSGASPSEWRMAEAELQRKTNMPFESPSDCRAERLSLAPRPGGKYHALTGADVEIAKVIGRDGARWFIIDVNGRPVVLKQIDFKWHALPRDNTPPRPGDCILHNGVASSVAEVLGEAKIGGWAVANGHGVVVHVLRSEGHRWVSFGSVAPVR